MTEGASPIPPRSQTLFRLATLWRGGTGCFPCAAVTAAESASITALRTGTHLGIFLPSFALVWERTFLAKLCFGGGRAWSSAIDRPPGRSGRCGEMRILSAVYRAFPTVTSRILWALWTLAAAFFPRSQTPFGNALRGWPLCGPAGQASRHAQRLPQRRTRTGAFHYLDDCALAARLHLRGGGRD
jgi:hypothetical protein